MSLPAYRTIRKAFVPEKKGGAGKAPECDGLTRGIFLVTTFVWDVEGAVLNAARTYGLTEVCCRRVRRQTHRTGRRDECKATS